jgi:hypothetical protein
MPGRRYYAVVDVTYLGGTIPDDAYDALLTGVNELMGGDVAGAVSHNDYDVITFRTEAPFGALDLLTDLCGAVEEALTTTGLFEEFDVSGMVMRAGPLHPMAG